MANKTTRTSDNRSLYYRIGPFQTLCCLSDAVNRSDAFLPVPETYGIYLPNRFPIYELLNWVLSLFPSSTQAASGVFDNVAGLLMKPCNSSSAILNATLISSRV